jgi:hypothetical protein
MSLSLPSLFHFLSPRSRSTTCGRSATPSTRQRWPAY